MVGCCQVIIYIITVGHIFNGLVLTGCGFALPNFLKGTKKDIKPPGYDDVEKREQQLYGAFYSTGVAGLAVVGVCILGLVAMCMDNGFLLLIFRICLIVGAVLLFVLGALLAGSESSLRKAFIGYWRPKMEQLAHQPTEPPTEPPTEQPTEHSTQQPTQQPIEQPTEQPTQQPTYQPAPQLKLPSPSPADVHALQAAYDCCGLSGDFPYGLSGDPPFSCCWEPKPSLSELELKKEIDQILTGLTPQPQCTKDIFKAKERPTCDDAVYGLFTAVAAGTAGVAFWTAVYLILLVVLSCCCGDK